MHQFNVPDANNRKTDLKGDVDMVASDKVASEFKKHNVRREFVELFNEFSLNVITNLHKTYFGKEYISSQKDILAHFKWCFEKTCDDFNKLNINFSNNLKLREYFLKHSLAFIYENKEYTESDYKADVDHFNSLMNYHQPKDLQHLMLMIELYHTFMRSFNCLDLLD